MTEKDLCSQLISQGEVCRTRSYAYSFAKELRSSGYFARVIQLHGLYFVIINEDEYNELWELRKACRAYEKEFSKHEIV